MLFKWYIKDACQKFPILFYMERLSNKQNVMESRKQT